MVEIARLTRADCGGDRGLGSRAQRARASPPAIGAGDAGGACCAITIHRGDAAFEAARGLSHTPEADEWTWTVLLRTELGARQSLPRASTVRSRPRCFA
jgi:hypothetical protein